MEERIFAQLVAGVFGVVAICFIVGALAHVLRNSKDVDDVE